MAKRTQQERLEEGLLRHGWVRDMNPSTRRYWVFTKPGDKRRMFVGKAGALRGGVTVSGALSYEKLRNQLLLEVAE